MGQNDKGSIFGGLTQMVVPSAAPQTTPPPAPSFDHLGAIQVAPSTGASKAPDSPSIGQRVSQAAEDIIPLAHEAKNLQENVVNPSAIGQQANQLVHENLAEHPERLAMGGEFGEGAANAAGEAVSEIPGAMKEAGNAVIDAVAHPTHAPAPAEGNPEAGVVRVNPIHTEVRDGLLNKVQQSADVKGAVQRADRAATENLASRPYVSPMREPNYVYRSRDIGEQGVPANEDSHAQLTSSKEQAQLYSQPGQRDSVTGKPQEVVRVDLNKLRPSDYSTKKMDGDVNWHKLKRDVPEHLVEKLPVDYHGAAKQAGVEFRGVQKGIEGEHPGLAIFQDPKSGTSVAVRLDEWSPAKLQEHVDAARTRMAGKQ